MLGQYPPTLTQILLFALWFESVTYSQMDRISFIEIKEKSQESVRLERLGNFSQSWQRSQNTSRESETPLPVFFHSRSYGKKYRGEVVHPATSGLLLRKWNISVFCAFSAQNSWRFLSLKILAEAGMTLKSFLCVLIHTTCLSIVQFEAGLLILWH